MRLAEFLTRPFDLLFPPACAGCGLPGDGVCTACRRWFAPPAPPGCRRCRHPWAVWTDRCAECPPALDALRFAAPYAGPLPAVVSALKDERRRGLAVDLAGLVGAVIRPPGSRVALVPVPLGPRRAHERGFNQSALLAAALADVWDVPVADVLRRVRDDPPQRGASATDRAENVRGAFAVHPARNAPPAAVIVDDVCTTGATLSACARALRRAGTDRVGAVCAARVLSGAGGVGSVGQG